MNLRILAHLLPVKNNRLLCIGLIGLFAASGCRFLTTADDFTPIPPLVTEEPPELAFESLSALTSASAPERDMADLAARFWGIVAPRTAQGEPLEQSVGDIASFWTKNFEADPNGQIEAELVYRSPALNMWVELGQHVDSDLMSEAAQLIEQKILPTNRALFGREWQPGVDGDPRINILHLSEINGVGVAYYWSGDEYVSAVNPFSNQRELLYIGLKSGAVGSAAYFSSIAHELQHLIQWHVDTNEEAWLNEGFAELASHVNGYPSGRSGTYASHTDIQLNTLRHERDLISAHYAAASMFTIYLFDRFGTEAVGSLSRSLDNGLVGVEKLLADMDAGLSVNDLFADWLVANYLAGEEREFGVYQYRSLDVHPLETETVSRFPHGDSAAVSQFGADYVQLSSSEPVTFIFTGTQQVNLIDALPHSGSRYWVSLPADESNMSLTRAFDLSGLDQATLRFWTWYDIEEGWDYGYVVVSDDGGQTWTPLETGATTTDNPEGNSLGHGFTGVSGDGQLPEWTEETADLSQFAGRSILVRFQYVTDGAVHGQGMVIDDVAIPELGYADDVEGGDAGWVATGFARTGQTLPQEFIVQLILLGDEEPKIQRLQLDENRQGQWQIPMDKRHGQAILILSGVTPFTVAAAAYDYELFR